MWPSDPGIDKFPEKKKIWDFWFTDYNPAFWEHIFGDDPLNTGKDLCPSLADLFPRCSWFTYHCTSLTSALATVSMITINKGEKVFGQPAKNDVKHPRYGQKRKQHTSAMNMAPPAANPGQAAAGLWATLCDGLLPSATLF